jgi:hypothetical protein
MSTTPPSAPPTPAASISPQQQEQQQRERQQREDQELQRREEFDRQEQERAAREGRPYQPLQARQPQTTGEALAADLSEVITLVQQRIGNTHEGKELVQTLRQRMQTVKARQK